MPTANEKYRDSVLRHHVGLRRYSAGVNRQIAKLLEQADKELTEKLRTKLPELKDKPMNFRGRRWLSLLKEVDQARAVAHGDMRSRLTEEFSDLAVDVGDRELTNLTTALPFAHQFRTVSPARLKAIATAKPFQGRLLKDWYAGLEATDKARLRQAIQQGMTQGESIDDIVRRVAGTRAKKYTDGALSITRRNAQAVARTAIAHIANKAQEAVWEENSDILTAKVWFATLDGRTSDICRLNDGRGQPTGDNKKMPDGLKWTVPRTLDIPAHFNERSLWVSYIDADSLMADRPYVTDTRTRQKREIDFRKEAKQRGMTVQQVRKEWAAKNIGQVPGKTTYEKFLKRQDAAFQDEVLGRTKGKLFRQGKLTLEQMHDRRGNELTLEQLRGTFPALFKNGKKI